MAENTPMTAAMPVALNFLKEKGFCEVSIGRMLQRCSGLGKAGAEESMQPNWAFLEQQLGIRKRKLPAMVLRCPQLLVLGLQQKLKPMAECLVGLGAKRVELAAAILRFPFLYTTLPTEEKLPTEEFLRKCILPTCK